MARTRLESGGGRMPSKHLPENPPTAHERDEGRHERDHQHSGSHIELRSRAKIRARVAEAALERAVGMLRQSPLC